MVPFNIHHHYVPQKLLGKCYSYASWLFIFLPPLRMGGAILLCPLYTFMGCKGTILPVPFLPLTPAQLSALLLIFYSYLNVHTHTHTPMTKEQTEKSASVTRHCHCCKYSLYTSEKNHHYLRTVTVGTLGTGTLAYVSVSRLSDIQKSVYA